MNLQTMIGMAEVFHSSIQYTQENWKKDILEKWDKTYDMPRKMKKKVRKRLQLGGEALSESWFNKADEAHKRKGGE